mgnify:CR=1 FL=1
MSLKLRISEDMKTAMRAKDAATLSTVRMLLAAIKQVEVDERIEVDDAQIVAIIGKMVKQRKDAAKIYAEAGRTDMAEKEQAEIGVLSAYLPAMLGEAEIQAAIAAAMAQTQASGMADMGKVMAVLKPALAGQADMAQVSQLLKAALQAL